jgi:hypothetical protein
MRRPPGKREIVAADQPGLRKAAGVVDQRRVERDFKCTAHT